MCADLPLIHTASSKGKDGEAREVEGWKVEEGTDLGQLVLVVVGLTSSYVEEDLHDGGFNSLSEVEGGGSQDKRNSRSRAGAPSHKAVLIMFKDIPTFCKSADPFLWLCTRGVRR